jgi:hypothetical protein
MARLNFNIELCSLHQVFSLLWTEATPFVKAKAVFALLLIATAFLSHRTGARGLEARRRRTCRLGEGSHGLGGANAWHLSRFSVSCVDTPVSSIRLFAGLGCECAGLVPVLSSTVRV